MRVNLKEGLIEIFKDVSLTVDKKELTDNEEKEMIKELIEPLIKSFDKLGHFIYKNATHRYIL